MSATTMNLPCTRFVKRVNNGALGSKYSYIAMMADNAKALEGAPWHESSVPVQNVTMPVNKVTETDAEYDESGAMTKPPSFSAYISDGFDCFQQGGDARAETATMCGYAGCVAYRFKIPASAASVPLSAVGLTIQRDRYCRAGVRVALVLSNDATPSDDWAVVRGEDDGAIVSASTPNDSLGVASWGFLAQSNVPNLVSGRAADGTITFNASGDGGFSGLSETGCAYLWVYLTLEDYQSYWTMYNSRESRYYSIEGSAMLVASKARFTFADDVTADEEESEGTKYLVDPIPVRVTHVEDWHRTLRPRICFAALSVAEGYTPVGADARLPTKSILLPVAKWTFQEGMYDLPAVYALATDGLRIPEGDYVIECWIDETGDGKFQPGEPYGCARAYGLSSASAPARLDIELTEVHPSIPRVDLSRIIAGMPQTVETPSSPHPVSDSDFAQIAAATDRGQWNIPWAAVEASNYPGVRPAESRLTRIRVVRSKFVMYDGLSYAATADTILDRYFELSERSVMTEADILADGNIELDFGGATKDWVDNFQGAPAALGGTTYRIVIGDGKVASSEAGCDQNLPILFTNHYETIGVTPSIVTPDEALEDKVYTGRPTFRWSHENTIAKKYSAFILFVYADDSGTTKVYDSGVLPAPARDAGGMYEWTAPIYAGMTTDEGVTLAAGTTYYWCAQMLDAKFYESYPPAGVDVLCPFSFGA